MKVTLLTVTYNSENYLEECINSVIAQTHPDIEHIIVDAASTDGTLEIIRKYNGHIAQWVSEKDNGMYDAINKGITMATGGIIGILNSDDKLAAPDVISDIVHCFTDQHVDAVYGDLVYVEKKNTSRVLRYWKGFSYKRYRFNYGWMPAHPTFYVRTSLIAELGGYESHYYTAADYEFMARYLYRFRINARYLPKLIVKMRSGGQSNKTLAIRLRANRRDYLAMKKNKIPFPLAASILKPIIKLHQYYYTFFRKNI
ncbi:glycosyltransferase family 2 protein [Ferruginibacter paludis]|uniref:glycosyltransferase family 2 protein n=1 Tax=Ferruginibacter paludis TaxID=1310417 RepID=UPI0025B2C6B8|nr:glycosyltransferase family 2 protein [Ferruginibacter paludis]MDN3655850.1 glycosyltransferase family 2 protein [Ferruginibacter paludis]